MRNFYQQHQSQTNVTPNGFQFSPANRSSNLTSPQSNCQTSINSYIDSVSSAVAIASGANKKPDAPVTKPIVTSPNRPQPPPVPPKQNRLTKKLIALNSSLNNSSVLSSNPVYLDMSNNNNSNHSSLEFKTNYDNDLVIEPSSSSSTSSSHHVNSTGSSSPSNQAFEDNDMDYQNFTSNTTAAKFLNPTKMLHQMKAKNSSSTSDLLNEKQNERFFESNTLYKKELKKKQRDILTTTPNNLINYQNLENHMTEPTNRHKSTLQHHQHLNPYKPVVEASAQQPVLKPSSPKKASSLSHSNSTSSGSSTSAPGQTTNSNKMINLFTNLISRSNHQKTPQPHSRSGIDQHNSTTNSLDISTDSHVALNNSFSHNYTSNLSPSEQNTGQTYSNLKYLKRASSSTHLKKAQVSQTKPSAQKIGQILLGHSVQPVIHQRTTEAGSKMSFNPANLFNSRFSSHKYQVPASTDSYLNTTIETEQTNQHSPTKKQNSPGNQLSKANSNKYRRSFDDVSTLLSSVPLQMASPSSSSNSSQRPDTDSSHKSTKTSRDSNKFEHTAFSTKNNGLIFMPSAARTPSPTPSPTRVSTTSTQPTKLDPTRPTRPGVALSNYEKLETYDENLNPTSGVELNIKDNSSHNNHNAFENVVYSYVDNLRMQSKRFSEVNLLSKSQAAAALAVANQIEITINNNNNGASHQPMSQKSTSASSPSSSLSSVLSAAGSPTPSSSFLSTINSQNLAAAASAVEQKLNISSHSSLRNSTSSTSSNSTNLRGSTSSINKFENKFYSTNSNPSLKLANNYLDYSLPKEHGKVAQQQAKSLSGLSSTSSSSHSASDSSLSSLSQVKTNIQQTEVTACTKTEDVVPNNFAQTSPKDTSQKSNQIIDLHSSYSTTCSSMLSSEERPMTKENLSILSLAASRIKPCLSSSSSTSSSSSSASSSSSTTSNYDLIEATIEQSNNNSNSSSASTDTNEITKPPVLDVDEEPEVDFNFFHEFYAVRSDNQNIRLPRKNAKFSSLLQDTLNMFLKMFFANDFYVQNILNPALPEWGSINTTSNTTGTTSSNYTHQIECHTDFCFRFTLDFCTGILLNKLKLKEQNQIVESNDLDVNQETGNANQTSEVNCSLLNTTAASTDNCYNYLINDLISMGNNNDPANNRGTDSSSSSSSRSSSSSSSSSDKIQSDQAIKFDLIKEKIKYLLAKKLNYFIEQQKKTSKLTELNEKLGNKILKNLEQNSQLTKLELDKYKLLVNESDVINNLLFKLSNKLGTIENSIQIVELKHLQSTKYDTFSSCCVELGAEATKELDLLKQEYNQIMRKKEEAVFLKNGINRRATAVTDILVNHLTTEQLNEFKAYMQMKCIHSMQLRHVKDHIDLTQLQVKLLENLYSPVE